MVIKVGGWAVRAALVMLAVAGLCGCPKKASWIPNGKGGYTLMTRASSMDQVVTRFRRTAVDLCGPSPYTLSDPKVVDRGWSYGPGGGGTTVTVQADLDCQQ